MNMYIYMYHMYCRNTPFDPNVVGKSLEFPSLVGQFSPIRLVLGGIALGEGALP